MKAGKIVALVVGILTVIIAVGLIAGAVSVLTADRDDGYFTTDDHPYQRDSYAIASENIDMLSDAPSWLTDWVADIVDLRVVGETNTGQAIFIGVAAADDLDTYLAGVAYDEVTDLTFDPFEATYLRYEGAAAPALPATQTLWVASVEGTGRQTLEWSAESGDWQVVVMNADASAGVDTELALGVKVSGLIPLVWGGLALGLVLLAAGGFLVYVGVRSREEAAPLEAPTPVSEATGPEAEAAPAGAEEEHETLTSS